MCVLDLVVIVIQGKSFRALQTIQYATQTGGKMEENEAIVRGIFQKVANFLGEGKKLYVENGVKDLFLKELEAKDATIQGLREEVIKLQQKESVWLQREQEWGKTWTDKMNEISTLTSELARVRREAENLITLGKEALGKEAGEMSKKWIGKYQALEAKLARYEAVVEAGRELKTANDTKPYDDSIYHARLYQLWAALTSLSGEAPIGRCCDNGNFGEEHKCQKSKGESEG
jgi:hypothetical protein